MREVVILKTLGATKRRVQRVFSIEFLTLGGVAGLLGALLAAAFSSLVLKRLLDAKFQFDFAGHRVAILGTALLANALRLAGEFPDSCGKSRWRFLREE